MSMSISTRVHPTPRSRLLSRLLTQFLSLSSSLALGLHCAGPSGFAFQPSALFRSILRLSLSLRSSCQPAVASFGAAIIWLRISPAVLARRSVKM